MSKEVRSKTLKCVCGCNYFYRSYVERKVFTETVGSTGDGKVVVISTCTDWDGEPKQPEKMKCTDCGREVRNPDSQALHYMVDK